MKITRKQLRQLISESMLQPTFFLNMKAREELLPKIVADPNVHPKIKELLQSGEEAQTNQGAELLKTMNPEYIEELESYESHQDSIEYDREFEEQRDNLFFIHIKSIVDKYKHDMGIPLQSDDLTVENISKDTTAGSYTDRSNPGRRVKRFTHKRLHGAAIYATDKATLERIARELESEKGMGGEQLYHSTGGQGQPLLPYINDYYLTAFDSNLKYKNEMHKKGKYELKVFPATPDQRIYKQPTHRSLNLSMYEMKLTRKKLRSLIETRIKPSIPNIPSGDAYEKIDNMARSEDLQADADSIAGAFGYPEDQSFSQDLRFYDDSGRLGPAIEQMRDLGTKYADAETHGEPEEFYFRRNALRKAAEICDSFDMSMVRPLIDSFTDAANDYEKKRAMRIGRTSRFRYEAYDIAGRISLKSQKLDPSKKENYSNLYDGTYINETRIKPTIPNIPSGEAYTKIDDLARQEEFQLSADSMAGAFGYPEGRSYSEDLRTYDQANMPTLETVSVYRHPNLEIAIPSELVDDVIDAHLAFKKTGGFPGSSIFRQAAIRVFHYVEDETKRIAGEDKNVYEYGLAVRGYRADEYEAAMMAVGEYI